MFYYKSNMSSTGPLILFHSVFLGGLMLPLEIIRPLGDWYGLVCFQIVAEGGEARDSSLQDFVERTNSSPPCAMEPNSGFHRWASGYRSHVVRNVPLSRDCGGERGSALGPRATAPQRPGPDSDAADHQVRSGQVRRDSVRVGPSRPPPLRDRTGTECVCAAFYDDLGP